MSLPSVAPKPTCRFCSNQVPSAAIYFCRSCESKLPGGRVPAILTSSGMKINETDINIAIDETKAAIARENGDERQARIYEHAAQCAKWRRDSKKAVDGIEVYRGPSRQKFPVKRSAHTPDQVAQVMEASDRLGHVIESLRREGFGKDVLEIALVDVTIRLKKTYEPHQSPATLLHELSKMASDMAKDEEVEARNRIAKRRQEH